VGWEEDWDFMVSVCENREFICSNIVRDTGQTPIVLQVKFHENFTGTQFA